jgi:hypothetical protein
MAADWSPVWILVLAAASLSGWWLAVRPQASYRGICGTLSLLMVVMAVLLCVLAVSGQRRGRRPAPAARPAALAPQA